MVQAESVNEYTVEIFKTLPPTALAGMRLLVLLNAGAAVALLANYDKLQQVIGPTNIRNAMYWYIVGLFFCAVLAIAIYLTNYLLYRANFVRQESPRWYGKAQTWIVVGLPCAVLGLVCFMLGSYAAISNTATKALSIGHMISPARKFSVEHNGQILKVLYIVVSPDREMTSFSYVAVDSDGKLYPRLTPREITRFIPDH
jgi:hypothetical protein